MEQPAAPTPEKQARLEKERAEWSQVFENRAESHNSRIKRWGGVEMSAIDMAHEEALKDDASRDRYIERKEERERQARADEVTRAFREAEEARNGGSAPVRHGMFAENQQRTQMMDTMLSKKAETPDKNKSGV